MNSLLDVVLDLGEVLVPRRDLRRSAAALGVEPAAFAAAYWAERDPYDLGLSDGAYWTSVGRRLGLNLTQATIQQLVSTDVHDWTELEPDAGALVSELAGAGVRLTLLSNAPHSLARTARASRWARSFGLLVFSAEEGLAKPDRRLYDRVGERLGAAAQQLVFFDDRQINVDGALAAGWDAHLWQGVAPARAVLEQRGISLPHP